ISLSEVEASIAAPFTSKEATVEAVESVLQEGRAALASSFHAFKTTAVFSMVQFMSSVILIYFDSKLADFGYLVQDMLFTLPILFTVSYSKSAAGLTKKTPLGSLMSFPVVSSLLIHVAMTLIYQILCLVILITVCKDFVPLPIDDEDYDLHVQSYEMTTVLFSSFVSYFVSGFVLHVYDKHLEAWYRNIAFDIAMVFVLAMGIFFFAQNIKAFNDFLMIKPTRDPVFFIFIVISLLVMMGILALLEYGVCKANLPKRIMEHFHPQRRLEPIIKKRKQVIYDEEEFKQDKIEEKIELFEQLVEKPKDQDKNQIIGKIKKQVIEWKEIEYRKPFYALLHEMKTFGEQKSSV
ncbi:MAG: putative cation translocating P-type ATPase, partial [Streblomastix strix]